ncbi:hypothetical protein [Kocuria marina]|uniref:hypothetical protein n=1 Tax=Kocuria marina TaxID=223184 RepID=UPI003F2227BC
MSQIVSYREDYYDPRRPRVISTAGLGISLTVAACASLLAVGRPGALVFLLAVLGLLATAAMVVATRRLWLKRDARPAAMRQAIAATVRQPLPEHMESQARRTLVASRYGWGSLTNPGPAKRIVLNARFLAMIDQMQLEKITAALSRVEGVTYVVRTKKNKPGRFIFTPKPEEARVELTEREQVEQRFTKAAREVFDPSATVSYEWETTPEGDYLTAAEISGINGLDIALSGKQNQVGRRLVSQLPDAAFRFIAYPNEDRFVLYRAKPLPALVMPPATRAQPIADHASYRRFEIPLGVGPGGAQAVWRPSRDAHLLVIGGTGGGKTICEHGVIQQATQAGWRVWLVDGKYIEFLGYDQWRNIEYLGQDVDSQIRLIYLAHETMKERYRLIRERKVRVEDLDPIMLVVDEVTSLLTAVDQRYQETKVKGMRAKPPVMEWLANIGRLARSAKMHLIFGMQRPDTTIIDGELRDNFGARISLGRLKSAAGSVMMWDNHAIGCQVPPIPGRAVSLINNEPTMIQATLNANPDPNHDDYNPGIIEAMTPEEEIYSRKAIQAPTPTGGGEDEAEPTVTWQNILEAKMLDSNGEEIIFDPIASEESRRFRAAHQNQHTAPQDPVLQTADSFEEAMALFPAPLEDQSTTSLDYGRTVAAAIVRTFHSADAKPRPVYEPRMAPPRPGPAVAPATHQPTFTTTVEQLQEGQYVQLEQLGVEIMVSEIHHEGHDCLIVGYDDQGQELSTELSPGAEVQARYADDDDLEEAA